MGATPGATPMTNKGHQSTDPEARGATRIPGFPNDFADKSE
jgi:hypothetical protein